MSNQDEIRDSRTLEEQQHTIQKSNSEDIRPPSTLKRDVLTRLGLARDQVSPLSTRPTQQLLKQLSTTEDWHERAWIVQCLAERGEKAQVEDIIIACLRDPAEGVRMAAIRALGKLWQSGPLRLGPFLNALVDSHPWVRATTVQVLASLKQQDLTDQLIALLEQRLEEKKEDEVVCIAIIQLLGTLGKRAPVQLLLDVSQDCGMSALVREAAVMALDVLRDNFPLEQLSRVLYDDDRFVRAAAISVLRTGVPVNDLLQDLEEDSDVARQAKAARVLGELDRHTPLVENALRKAATNVRKSSSVRVATLLALAQLGAAINEHTLAKLQHTDDEDIRNAAEILADVLQHKGKLAGP